MLVRLTRRGALVLTTSPRPMLHHPGRSRTEQFELKRFRKLIVPQPSCSVREQPLLHSIMLPTLLQAPQLLLRTTLQQSLSLDSSPYQERPLLLRARLRLQSLRTAELVLMRYH